jgi:hypothetical protein
MSIQHLVLIVFFLTTTAITSAGKEIESNSTGQTLTGKKELRTVTNSDLLLIEQQASRDFSQVGKKDKFYICIRGKSITEGQVLFTITSHDKKEIFREVFPSYLLMNYGFTGDLKSEKDRENYMKRRIKEFFKEKNFHSPAIKGDEVFNKDFSDKVIWTDIKSDRTTIGFYYLIGEEDGRKIAFSKKKNKIVMYFNCC